MNRLCVLFPRLRPIAYQKDVGQIPLSFARDLGWETCLVHTNVEPTPVDASTLSPWVECHDLGYWPNRAQRFAELSKWLHEHAHRFDTLLLYQLTLESAAYAHIYKEIRPDGVCFLKLDMDERSAAMLSNRRGWKQHLNDRAFASAPIDFFTVETTTLRDRVAPYFSKIGKPLHIFANGFTLDQHLIARRPPPKRKRVLNVARLGMPQKDTEGLVRAFLAIPARERQGWTLELVGPIENNFDTWLAEHGSDEIRLIGPIQDRDVLYRKFEEASVFALSSRWESFGLVLAEAAAARCYLVSTDVGAARDITQNGTLGDVVPTDDASALTQAIRRAMNRDNRSELGETVRERVLANYAWSSLCHEIVRVITRYRGA